MPIASLFNIPGTSEEFSEWAFAHAVHHIDINRVLYERFLVALPAYILDPFDPSNERAIDQWAYNHQLMHQAQNQALGISGFDLSSVNWQDEKQRAAWIQLNANEHLQASNILEIG